MRPSARRCWPCLPRWGATLLVGLALYLAVQLVPWRPTWLAVGLSQGLIAAVLAVLEISLSFDNAIVNANKLQTMRPEWQRRFLTWGIIIAVFGMRVIFPLLVVVIAAKIGPISAVNLAATQPAEYARLIHEAHLPIAAFGGSFLMLVALNYFFDQSKEVDWIGAFERWLRAFGSVRGMEIGFVLVTVLVFVWLLPKKDEGTFMYAAIWGVVTYLAVDALGAVLDRFLAEYANVNSFTQTVIVSRQRGLIRRFPPRTGLGPLI